MLGESSCITISYKLHWTLGKLILGGEIIDISILYYYYYYLYNIVISDNYI